MFNLEKNGDTAYVDITHATPGSLSHGIVAELRWSFIEMRERRNRIRTLFDLIVRFFRKPEDLDLGIFYEMKRWN